MLVRFRTNGPMNFGRYDYQIVIDACGGGTPYPNPNTTTYLDYTFSFNVGTSPFGLATTFPILIQYIVTPGTSNQLNPQIVRTSSSQTTLTPSDNGQGTEFALVFPRALLNAPLGPSALPCSSSRLSPAPTMLASRWKFNFFVIDPSALNSPTHGVLDSLGTGGPTDTSYNGAIIDTTTQNNTPIIKVTDITGFPSDPNAQIAGGEIDNYP